MDIKKVRDFVARKIVNTPQTAIGGIKAKLPASPGDSLNLASYVSRDVGEKEYVVTLHANNDAFLRDSNPRWGYSKKLNCLYTYFPASAADSLVNFLPVVGQPDEVEVRILQWRAEAKFPPSDVVDDLFLVRANRGFEIFESLLRP